MKVTFANADGTPPEDYAVRPDAVLLLEKDTNKLLVKADLGDAPSASSAEAASLAKSTALESSRVAKASAGNLYGFSVLNTKSTDQYVQVHNTASLPADGVAPVMVFLVPANSSFAVDLGRYPINFSTGITICNSSTAATKTIGASDCWFNVQYA